MGSRDRLKLGLALSLLNKALFYKSTMVSIQAKIVTRDGALLSRFLATVLGT